MGEYDDIGLPGDLPRDPVPGGDPPLPRAAQSTIKGAPFGVLWLGGGLLIVSLSIAVVMRSSSIWLAVAFVLGLLAASSALVALYVNQQRLRLPAYSYRGAEGFRRLSAVVFTGANALSLIYVVMVAYRVAVN
jgi:hypothetical protein